MNDPRRLMDVGADDFESDLLRSAQRDIASARAYHRTLATIGVGVALPLAIATAAQGAGAAKALSSAGKLGVALIAKWLTVGAALGVATVAGVELAQTASMTQDASPKASNEKRAERAPQPALPATATTAEVESPPTAEVIEPVSERDEFGGRSGPIKRARASTPSHSAAPLADETQPSEAEPANTDIDNAPTQDSLAHRLQREVALLDRARRALKHGNAHEALVALNIHERDFSGGGLAPEAAVLRVQALLESGNRGAAQQVANRLLTTNPGSQHARIVRTLLERSHNQ
jgi:hypothetical protein